MTQVTQGMLDNLTKRVEKLEKNPELSKLARDVATVIVVVFMILAVVLGGIALAQGATLTEVVWARATWAFGAIEAIAFAAAGFLFGKEVNRERADKAEEGKKKAEDEKDIAEAAKKKKQNGLVDALMEANRIRAESPRMFDSLHKNDPPTIELDNLISKIQEAIKDD